MFGARLTVPHHHAAGAIGVDRAAEDRAERVRVRGGRAVAPETIGAIAIGIVRLAARRHARWRPTGRRAAGVPGSVDATHQLFGCPSLQNELNGHWLEAVQTWWQAAPLPEPSSMHSLPAGHREETHCAVSLAAAQGSARSSAMAAAKASHGKGRKPRAGSMDDEACRRYASRGVGPRAAGTAMRTIRETGVGGVICALAWLCACGEAGAPRDDANRAAPRDGGGAPAPDGAICPVPATRARTASRIRRPRAAMATTRARARRPGASSRTSSSGYPNADRVEGPADDRARGLLRPVRQAATSCCT